MVGGLKMEYGDEADCRAISVFFEMEVNSKREKETGSQKLVGEERLVVGMDCYEDE